MKKIIKRIVDRIRFSYPIMIEESLTKILEEELPDFQRIDEERFKRIYASKVCDIGLHIQEYNSTLPPALVPLLKEMPKDFFRVHSGNDADDLWDWVVKHYGTPEPKPEYIRGKDKVLDDFCDSFEQQEAPAKPNLPSVEELARELNRVYWGSDKGMTSLAQNLHEKYSLPTREWWQDCEKFMYKGRAYKKYSHEVFPDGRTVLHSELAGHDLIYCTPYTPPSAQDIIAKHNLSEEEVKVLREGK